MRTVSIHNFHLPLSADLYESLKKTANHLQLPATQVARQALEEWLQQNRKKVLHDEIAAFANEHAGSHYDYDETFTNAAEEYLISIQ